MKLDETRLVSTIISYKTSLEDVFIQSFQEQVYHFIVDWAKKTYRCSEDISHDFLAYVLPFSAQIMNAYPIVLKASFKTWFSAVLVNKFYDFSKQNHVGVSYHSVEIFDERVSMIQSDSELSDDFWNAFHELTLEEQSILKLYAFPDQVEGVHIKAISEMTGHPIHVILEVYRDILKEREQKYKLKEITKDKINVLIKKLAHVNNIIKKIPVKVLNIMLK